MKRLPITRHMRWLIWSWRVERQGDCGSISVRCPTCDIAGALTRSIHFPKNHSFKVREGAVAVRQLQQILFLGPLGIAAAS